MKKVLLFIISLFIGLGLFLWVSSIVGWQEIKNILTAFSGWECLIILLFTTLIWLAGFWKWQYVLKSQGFNVPKRDLLQIMFASNTITYLLTPTAILGGEGFRVYALQKKFSVPLGKNLAAILIEKLLSLSIVLVFLITGLFSFLFLNQSLPGNITIISTIVIGFVSVALFIFYSRIFKKESIFNLILRFFGKKIKDHHLIEEIEKEFFAFFEFRKKTMWKGLGIALLRYSLIFTRCFFLIFFLSKEANILVALSAMFFMYLAYSFPLPAGFGSLEAAETFVFNSLGLGAATGISFSFILRGAEIIVSLFGLILLFRLGIILVKDAILGKIDNFEEKENL